MKNLKIHLSALERFSAMNVGLETRNSSSFRKIIPLPNLLECIIRSPRALEIFCVIESTLQKMDDSSSAETHLTSEKTNAGPLFNIPFD
jgi:hypothetical protein